MSEDDDHPLRDDVGRVAHRVHRAAEFGLTSRPADHAAALVRLHPLPHERVEVEGPQLAAGVARSHCPAVHVDLERFRLS